MKVLFNFSYWEESDTLKTEFELMGLMQKKCVSLQHEKQLSKRKFSF